LATIKKADAELEIVKFIEDHPGSTINQVAEEMSSKGICSRMTTLKKIQNLMLKERGMIDDRQERNGFHRLYINDKNEYKRIDNELSELEDLIEKMHEPAIKITALDPPQEIREVPKRWYVRELQDNFVIKYHESTIEMLYVLLIEIGKKIKFEKDAWSLYTRVIRLITKLEYQLSQPLSEGSDHTYLNASLVIQACRHYIQDLESETQEYAINLGIKDIVLLKDSLVTKLENFRKRFIDIYYETPIIEGQNINLTDKK